MPGHGRRRLLASALLLALALPGCAPAADAGREIRFPRHGFDLPEGVRPTLDDLARTLRRYPRMRVRLVGHTDDRGVTPSLVWLSTRRAEAVMHYLVDRGVKPHRIDYLGVGASRPVADNATREGRRRNNRVAIELL